MTGCPTGFIELDELTSGLQPSNLIVIGSRPSMGKTGFMLSIAQHCVLHRGRPRTVAILSLESPRHKLFQRWLCHCTQVSLRDLRKGNLNEEEQTRISRFWKVLAEAPLYVDDTLGIAVPELRVKALRLQKGHGLDVVFIDYLQLMRGSGSIENRVKDISDIMRQLKNMAQEINAPVIVLSLVGRGVEIRQDKRPVLSDLHESGPLDQYADTVAFIYRDGYYNPHGEAPNVAEVIIAKQPNGLLGTVKLYFAKRNASFHNLEQERREPDGGGSWQD